MKSKYPPAEPEALRLLAPQRGLIAIGTKTLLIEVPLKSEDIIPSAIFSKNPFNGWLKYWMSEALVYNKNVLC